MPIIFVTGTDTGCGKTHAACALIHALAAAGHSVAGYKPVASGCARTPQGLRNEDALALQAASTLPLRYDEVNPVALEPPVAPHIAAADVNLQIDIEALRAGAERLARRADWVVVEGAGGYLVPLGPGIEFADLTAGWPVLLVVGMRLGCLNHARLSAAEIGRRGRLLGWVGNVLPPVQSRLEENLASLREWLPAPCLGVLPAGLAAPQAAAEIDLRHLDAGAAFAPDSNTG